MREILSRFSMMAPTVRVGECGTLAAREKSGLYILRNIEENLLDIIGFLTRSRK